MSDLVEPGYGHFKGGGSVGADPNPISTKVVDVGKLIALEDLLVY